MIKLKEIVFDSIVKEVTSLREENRALYVELEDVRTVTNDYERDLVFLETLVHDLMEKNEILSKKLSTTEDQICMLKNSISCQMLSYEFEINPKNARW